MGILNLGRSIEIVTDEDGLPVFDTGSSSGSSKKQKTKVNVSYVKDFLVSSWTDQDSRSIATFLMINLSFMVVELVYGIWTNSLGLISDSVHMLFDCTALFIGLFVAYISKFKANNNYTFGYKRYEVLSGFFNSMFLVFVAIDILIESIERIFSP